MSSIRKQIPQKQIPFYKRFLGLLSVLFSPEASAARDACDRASELLAAKTWERSGEKMFIRDISLLKTLALAGGILLNASTGIAGLITFDDVSVSAGYDSYVPITNYQAFGWSNFRVLYGVGIPNSGIAAGVVSGTNDAVNPDDEKPSSIFSNVPFTLTSVYLTAAWNDGLDVLVQGLNGKTVLDSTVLVVGATEPALEMFNWSGLTDVELSAAGGTFHTAYSDTGGPSPNFVLDNLTLIPGPTPEPSTMLLLGVGLVVGFVLRTRLVAHLRSSVR